VLKAMPLPVAQEGRLNWIQWRSIDTLACNLCGGGGTVGKRRLWSAIPGPVFMPDR
jgi:hypothetical protein